MSLGRTNFQLYAVADTRYKQVRAEVVLSGPTAKAAYAELETQKPEIENELGVPLTWRNPTDAQLCTMFLRESANLDDRDQWPTYFAWLVEKLDTLHRVFSQRVKELDLDMDELENDET